MTTATSATRSAFVPRPARARSAVSNGTRLHVQPIGDTAWSRRFRDVLAQIVSDLGGADCLSEGQRQLARRAATISLECEKLEARAVGGDQIDLDVYGQLTDRLGRAFHRLGLRRVARDVSPTLEQVLASLPPAAQPEDDDDDQGSPPEAGASPVGASAAGVSVPGGSDVAADPNVVPCDTLTQIGSEQSR